MLLLVPHYPQEDPTSCIPAAVRMVLSFLSIELSELVLSYILQSEDEGTSVLNLEFLQEANMGVTVEVDEMDANRLKQSLEEGVPVIVAVWTVALPYWTKNRPHAVVVVGYDENVVYLNDPTIREAPQTVTWENFLVAWEEFGRFGAVIRKQQI